MSTEKQEDACKCLGRMSSQHLCQSNLLQNTTWCICFLLEVKIRENSFINLEKAQLSRHMQKKK